jgi:Prokaryotic N-terminal methylation motif
MLQFFAKRLNELHEVDRDERGFTLIELLVVITLLFHKWLCPPGLRPNLLPATRRAAQRR